MLQSEMKIQGALRPIEFRTIVKGALVLFLNFIGAPSVMPLPAADVPLNGADTGGIPVGHGLWCLRE